MTRKDYRLIASALKDSKPISNGPNSFAYDAAYEFRLGQWSKTTRLLSLALGADNARFDSDKFLQACGIPSEDTSAN